MGATPAMKTKKTNVMKAMKTKAMKAMKVAKTKTMKAMKTKVMKAMKTKTMKAMKAMKNTTAMTRNTTISELMTEYVDYMIWQTHYGVRFVSWRV